MPAARAAEVVAVESEVRDHFRHAKAALAAEFTQWLNGPLLHDLATFGDVFSNDPAANPNTAVGSGVLTSSVTRDTAVSGSSADTK